MLSIMPATTQLELGVLGTVWNSPGCTAYYVRRQFQGSVSAHWSGSKGAVYPALRRLARRRLLRSESSRTGKLTKRRYWITERGLSTLRSWLSPPLPDADAMPMFDPIRTRVCFMGALPRAERLALLSECETSLRAALERTRERRGDCLDEFDEFALLGCISEIAARLRWAQGIRRKLTED